MYYALYTLCLRNTLKIDIDIITKHRIKCLTVELNATFSGQSITFSLITNGAMNNNICFIHSSMGLQINSFPAAPCLLWNALFIGRLTLKCVLFEFRLILKEWMYACVLISLIVSAALIIFVTCLDFWFPLFLYSYLGFI